MSCPLVLLVLHLVEGHSSRGMNDLAVTSCDVIHGYARKLADSHNTNCTCLFKHKRHTNASDIKKTGLRELEMLC